MKAYYYTEDEALGRFVTAEYDLAKDNYVDLTGEVSQRLRGEFSDKECLEELKPEGFAISIISKVFTAYVSFVFLLDITASNGRMKVVYGCTQSTWLTDSLIGRGQKICDGLRTFCKKNGLRFSEDRLAKLNQSIDEVVKARRRR